MLRILVLAILFTSVCGDWITALSVLCSSSTLGLEPSLCLTNCSSCVHSSWSVSWCSSARLTIADSSVFIGGVQLGSFDNIELCWPSTPFSIEKTSGIIQFLSEDKMLPYKVECKDTTYWAQCDAKSSIIIFLLILFILVLLVIIALITLVIYWFKRSRTKENYVVAPKSNSYNIQSNHNKVPSIFSLSNSNKKGSTFVDLSVSSRASVETIKSTKSHLPKTVPLLEEISEETLPTIDDLELEILKEESAQFGSILTNKTEIPYQNFTSLEEKKSTRKTFSPRKLFMKEDKNITKTALSPRSLKEDFLSSEDDEYAHRGSESLPVLRTEVSEDWGNDSRAPDVYGSESENLLY